MKQNFLTSGELLDHHGTLNQAGYAYQLVKGYHRKAIKANPLRIKEWDYIVEEQNTQSIDVIEHGYDSFNAEVASQGYYIVYSWGKGLPPFEYFDLRGN